MRIAVLAIGLLASPAMAADQFDLVCTAKKDAAHYRVDLVAGEWCASDCLVVNKIASVTSGVLTLLDHEAARRGDSENKIEINRTTGAWSDSVYDPSISFFADTPGGVCTPAPFSGLPKPKF